MYPKQNPCATGNTVVLWVWKLTGDITNGQGNMAETRTEKGAIAVTPSEKKAVRAVAAIQDTDESNLCRVMPIADIVTEYNRIREAV